MSSTHAAAAHPDTNTPTLERRGVRASDKN
jgi:hypothetical protein